MMSNLRRLLLSAAAVALGAAGAQAQLAPWSPTPLGPPAFPRSVAPAASSSAAFPGSVALAGCSNCGAPGAGIPSSNPGVPIGHIHNPGSHPVAAKVLDPVLIGAGCASNPGCSTPAAERTFAFGSCSQFFNPGNKCRIFGNLGGCGNAGGCGGGRGLIDYEPTLYGPGRIGNPNPCVYGSYQDR